MPPVPAGIYVHVPFCSSKCSYCSFYSLVESPEHIKKYHHCVLQQIETLKTAAPWRELTFDTIFFGGGTPSVLPPEMLTGILDTLINSFHLSPDEMEISLEVNPATINRQQLVQLKRSGFNRISIGTQSFDDHELARIGRIHTAADAVKTFKDAENAGFDNINIDLMYGLPDQDIDSWIVNLDKALALGPQHLSLYELTLEPDTPLYGQMKTNSITLPQEETILEMMAIIRPMLDVKNYIRYEISNYSLSGYQCRHNLTYWQNGSYLGIGPGAVSSHGGVRWAAMKNIASYCHQVRDDIDESLCESLDKEAYFRETVVMGLRMTRGIDVDLLSQRFQLDLFTYYENTLRNLIDQGFLIHEDGFLYLSGKGMPVADSVMAQLV